MSSVQFTLGLANWLAKEQLGQEFSPQTRERLTAYLNTIFEAHPMLTPSCYWIILEYFSRMLSHHQLAYVHTLTHRLKKPLNPDDATAMLAFLFSAHLCFKYVAEHDEIYDLITLKDFFTELDGLNFIHCEMFFIKLMDWNFNSKIPFEKTDGLFSKLSALASYFSDEKPLEGCMHPWQLFKGVNKDNVLLHSVSQPARVLAYQFFGIQKPTHPYAQTTPPISLLGQSASNMTSQPQPKENIAAIPCKDALKASDEKKYKWTLYTSASFVA